MQNALLYLARLWKIPSSEFMGKSEALQRMIKNRDGNIKVKDIPR